MNQNTLAAAVRYVMPLARATGLFVSLATLQQPSGAVDAYGAPTGLYANVAGLVDIPCTAAPKSDSSISATESRALAEITAAEWQRVLLDGYYPTIDAGWRGDDAGSTGPWRILIDGWPYDIAGAESDSQYQMTRIMIRLVSL